MSERYIVSEDYKKMSLKNVEKLNVEVGLKLEHVRSASSWDVIGARIFTFDFGPSTLKKKEEEVRNYVSR